MKTFASANRSEENAPAHLITRSHSGKVPERENAPPVSSSIPMIQRKAACPCGGGCPVCQDKTNDLKVSQANDTAEIEADQIAEKVMRMALHEAPPVAEKENSTSIIHRKCDACEDKEEKIQRKTLPAGGSMPSQGPAHVRDAINSGGFSLDRDTRSFFEPCLGYDLNSVRIYTNTAAAQSACAFDAKAYTLGSNIVFGRNEYAPDTHSGKHLLAHELVHVSQQRARNADGIHRTPANKVSCANNTPLVIPGTGVSIADPVGVITVAEDRANEMFDAVIGELDFTRQQILAGATVGWPTISDALAEGLQLMGLDPDDAAIWTAPAGTGQRSVPLLLRRLRMIRNTIGAGSFFFFCLGTGMPRLGNCVAAAGNPDICTGAVLTTCPGEFFTAMCPPFWSLSAENQAARIVHESAHNFATFIGHTGRFTNAECFARLVQVFAGVPVAEQRLDLCPDL